MSFYVLSIRQHNAFRNDDKVTQPTPQTSVRVDWLFCGVIDMQIYSSLMITNHELSYITALLTSSTLHKDGHLLERVGSKRVRKERILTILLIKTHDS